MSELSKGQLRSDNNSSFPNNNTQAITPTIIRDFNGNIIDSLVDEITYQADSGSWNSQLAAIEHTQTGSLLTTASFSEGTRDMTFTKGDGTTFTTNIADGGAIDTGSLLKNAEAVINTNDIRFTKGDSTTFDVSIVSASHADISSTSQQADFVPYSGVTGKPSLVSGSSQITYPLISNIPSGILSGSVVDKLPTGTVSGSVQVSYPELSNIPAGIVSGSVVTSLPSGTVSGSSQIDYPNISNIPAGLISGSTQVSYPDLSNIPSGIVSSSEQLPGGLVSGSYISSIVGGTDIDATTVSGVTTIDNTLDTSTFAKTNVNNNFPDTQSFDVITAVTASFGHINYVTGSATIIGDAFVVLNADTPTLPFAGIKVYDSGSAATASFEWNGDSDSWIVVEEGGLSANIITAPIGTKGSEALLTTNTVPKSGTENQLADSNITDSGTTITLGSNTDVTGILTATQFSGMISGSSQVSYLGITNVPSGIISGSEGLPGGLVSGSSQVDITATTNYGNVATLAGANTFNGALNTFTTDVNLNGTNNIPTIANNVTVSNGLNGGYLKVIGNNPVGRESKVAAGTVTATNDGVTKAYIGGGFDSFMSVYDDNDHTELTFVLKAQSYSNGTYPWTGPGIIVNATPVDAWDTVIGFQNKTTYTDNRVTFLTPVELNNSVQTNITTVTPAANVATVDFSATGLVEIALTANALTTINASNIQLGTTINIKITQDSTTAGTVAFSSDFKQPDGSAYVATTDLGAVDILTLMTFTSTSDIYVVAVNKFV